MTNHHDRKLTMYRRFEHSAERVFAAWVEPEAAARWLFASSGDESYSAERELRPGGRWTITARRGGKDYTAEGEYLAVERPHRLVFSFAMPQFSPHRDRITVTLAPELAGCLMTFTQEGVDIAAELAGLADGIAGDSELGWDWMFARMEQSLSS